MYENRLEIWNLGELLNQLHYEDLKKSPHASIVRNTKIAHVFYIREYIEKWGSGTTRMVDACKEQRLPEPEFFQHSGGFCVSFKFAEDVPISSAVVKRTEPSRQEEIISILTSHPQGLAISEIMEALTIKISRATVKRELESLEQLHVARREGLGKATKWLII